MSVKLLTEHHLEFLSLKGGCTGSSESTLVKMPHCWKSHVPAQLYITFDISFDYQFHMFLSSTARNNSEISSNLESRLLITFAKCLDPDQSPKISLMVLLKEFF